MYSTWLLNQPANPSLGPLATMWVCGRWSDLPPMYPASAARLRDPTRRGMPWAFDDPSARTTRPSPQHEVDVRPADSADGRQQRLITRDPARAGSRSRRWYCFAGMAAALQAS